MEVRNSWRIRPAIDVSVTGATNQERLKPWLLHSSISSEMISDFVSIAPNISTAMEERVMIVSTKSPWKDAYQKSQFAQA